MKSLLKRIVLVVFAATMLPATVFAQDEPPIVKRMLDMMATQMGGNRPTYDSLQLDNGGTVTIGGLKFTLSQKDVQMTGEVGTLTLTGISERPSGTLSAASGRWQDVKLTITTADIPPIEVSAPDSTATNMHIIPAVNAQTGKANVFPDATIYETAELPVFTVNVAGKAFNLNGFHMTWKGDPDTGLGSYTMSLDSFVLNRSDIPDPSTAGMLEALGYDKIDLGLEGSFAIEEAEGKLSMGYAFSLNARNMGKIEMAFAGKDVPSNLFATLKEINDGKKANMNALMPMLFSMKFSGIKLRFEDASITEKALALAAQMKGQTTEQLIGEGTAMLQGGLAQLGVPEFAAKVVDAFKSFVTKPKNITIQAQPPAPVAVGAMMGLAAAPQAAIEMLGVSVTAND